MADRRPLVIVSGQVRELPAADTTPLSAVGGFGANVATFLATPSSENLAAAITDETGLGTAGVAVFSEGPSFTAAMKVAVTFANPASGGTVTLTNSTQHYQKVGTGAIASLTVNLPASPSNGQICSFGFAGVVTSLTVGSAGSDTVLAAPTTAAAGSCFEWIYNSTTTTWYRRN